MPDHSKGIDGVPGAAPAAAAAADMAVWAEAAAAVGAAPLRSTSVAARISALIPPAGRGGVGSIPAYILVIGSVERAVQWERWERRVPDYLPSQQQ